LAELTAVQKVILLLQVRNKNLKSGERAHVFKYYWDVDALCAARPCANIEEDGTGMESANYVECITDDDIDLSGIGKNCLTKVSFSFPFF